MPPDRRLAWTSPVWLARQAALARWRACSPEVRLAWVARPSTFIADDAGACDVDWPRLLKAEQQLSAAVRAGHPWETLIPQGWEARESFLDAFPGLTGDEQKALASAARHWLYSTPYQAWLKPPHTGARPAEFTPLSPPTPTSLNDLWKRVHMPPADLTFTSSAALTVLAQVDCGPYIDLLGTLPPILLWMVAGQEDPDLLLTLAQSSLVVPASYGAWHYWTYIKALEGFGNTLARRLNPLHSTRDEVGKALRQREMMRSELRQRVAALVSGLGGGDQRPLLLLRLIEGAIDYPNHWAALYLANGAATALTQSLSAAPDEAALTQIQAAISSNDRVGPLAAALLALAALTPEDRDAWRRIVLDHLVRRLTLPQDDDPHALGPLSLESESSTLMYAGRLLAAWLGEDPEATTAWFARGFATLPIRATRQEPRSWLFGPRAAFLWMLGAETLARASEHRAGLTALLVKELEARTPEWEWTNGLGERPFSEWQVAAILNSRDLLTSKQREQMADASRSLWVMVQLLEAPQLSRREEVLAARLETDLPAVALPVLMSLEARFTKLRRWQELGACRQRRRVLQGQQRSGADSGLLGPTLDTLVQFGKHPEVLMWKARLARQSYTHDAGQAYTLLAHVLCELTGEPEWRHAVADAKAWELMVLERPTH